MHRSVDLGKNFRISDKQWLSDGIFSMWVEAPDIASAFLPGQFVIIRIDEKGERIPLTIAAVDEERKKIRLVVQVVGFTTGRLSAMDPPDAILDLVGPLGKPAEIGKHTGPVLGVAGGLGAAPILPQLAAHRAVGNQVVTILGARSAGQLILTDELESVSDSLHIITDDGSSGRKGLVTDAMAGLLDEGLKPSLVIAIGPPIMMKFTCRMAVERGITVMASLNPIMVDGTGMCGGCRVTVGEKTYFACVDGPDFDGCEVNWDELIARLGTYRDQERKVLDHNCRLSQGRMVP